MIVQKCCPECGSLLIEKELDNEGMVPYCNSCKEYRFPMYNVAVSMITIDTKNNNVLLIQQYGKKDNILVAGYVNITESLENAVYRELKEEMNLIPSRIEFNATKYFPKTNTLMCNFIAYMEDISKLKTNNEIDSFNWFSFIDGLSNIKPDSTAKYFYELFYEKYVK
ncbi:NAD+ diphosphatase [Anaeroplasma bactoclasticum]|jgi:NAD+ diphosphatase|uniref:NAD+ diphosphatase n=1 Tax=Anaeroplasma bactoclasticum TaxID=2088 RepID=A0A397RZN3_9MOLU|nr:NUDIX domain-containing protein [Anaeroplasma bactoclasticum]RIA75811.1 NAD+ diphosphatase [Anaeroplasma bactoclasticum]